MQMRLFRQLAQEMIDNGHQTLKGVTYYRHPNPMYVSKVTLTHSNILKDEDGYFERVIRDLEPEEREEELALELRRRFHKAKHRWTVNHYGVRERVWFDPCCFRKGFRSWLLSHKK